MNEIIVNIIILSKYILNIYNIIKKNLLNIVMFAWYIVYCEAKL